MTVCRVETLGTAMTTLVVALLLGFLVLGEVQAANRRHVRQIVFPDDNDDRTDSSSSPSAQRGGEPCLTTSRTRGVCILLDECPALQSIRDYNVLRRAICGYNRFDPKVCCPQTGEATPKPTRRPTRTPRPPTRTPRPTRPPPSPRVPVSPPRRPTPTPEPTELVDGLPRALPKNCGRNNITNTRIVNGEEALPGSWPWLVALYIEEGGIKSASCGASIISESFVLTAAHCVIDANGKDLPASAFTARLGEHNLKVDNEGSVDIPVSKVTKHKEFVRRTYKNDIALLKLSRKAKFSLTVQPVCLPYGTQERAALTGRKAFVAGWGTTSFDGPSSDILLQVQFPIWDFDECKEAYKNDLAITSEYLCAGDLKGAKDSCQGDSGGPMMLPAGPENRFYQYGIVSFGKKCATPGFPGVYTNLRLYLNWIANNLK